MQFIAMTRMALKVEDSTRLSILVTWLPLNIKNTEWNATSLSASKLAWIQVWAFTNTIRDITFPAMYSSLKDNKMTEFVKLFVYSDQVKTPPGNPQNASFAYDFKTWKNVEYDFKTWKLKNKSN